MALPKLKDIKWVTTDCYGTLIDWEKGIMDAFNREADRDGLTDPFDPQRRVGRDAVGKHDARVGVRPSLDLIELLHADRHTAERLRDVSRARRCLCFLAGQVAERVERAGLDGVVRRLQLLDRRAAAGPEFLDERARITLPRCVPHGRRRYPAAPPRCVGGRHRRG